MATVPTSIINDLIHEAMSKERSIPDFAGSIIEEYLYDQGGDPFMDSGISPNYIFLRPFGQCTQGVQYQVNNEEEHFDDALSFAMDLYQSAYGSEPEVCVFNPASRFAGEDTETEGIDFAVSEELDANSIYVGARISLGEVF